MRHIINFADCGGERARKVKGEVLMYNHGGLGLMKRGGDLVLVSHSHTSFIGREGFVRIA